MDILIDFGCPLYDLEYQQGLTRGQTGKTKDINKRLTLVFYEKKGYQNAGTNNYDFSRV